MTYENKFCYRIIYRIIFESIVFTYYIKSNRSLIFFQVTGKKFVCNLLSVFSISTYYQNEEYTLMVAGLLASGILACGQLAWRTTDMRKIDMEDNWH